jgi:hypothetical protein
VSGPEEFAFPLAASAATHWEASRGMTLRDYFAAQAMIGLFGFWVAVNAKTNINDPDPDIVSEMAYEYADAMLEARSAKCD